jgi:hypothetical protein
MAPSVTTDVPSSYRSNELDIEIFLVNILECTQSVVQLFRERVGVRLVSNRSPDTAKLGKTLQKQYLQIRHTLCARSGARALFRPLPTLLARHLPTNWRASASVLNVAFVCASGIALILTSKIA